MDILEILEEAGFGSGEINVFQAWWNGDNGIYSECMELIDEMMAVVNYG